MHISDKKNSVVLALGYFDSVHIGHREVIRRAKQQAEKFNNKLVVFTFAGNLRAFIGGGKQKFVFTPSEREQLLLGLGADEVCFAPVNKEFLSLTKEEFLDKLNDLYDIKCYVSGNDYRFGKGACGDVEYLARYAKSKHQSVIIVEGVLWDNERVSTTGIKELLLNGEIDKANVLLGSKYFVKGEVVHDRGVGKKLGYPTANLEIKEERQHLKNGVYSGWAMVGDEKYLAVINYGSRPTFSDEKVVIEAHLIDFSQNLYGKQLTVFFDGFIRDIKTFKSEIELKEQLKKDVDYVVKKHD